MKILKQLLLAAQQIGAIGKDKKNEQQGYRYRGIEDVMNAVHPAFIDNGIVCVSKVLDQKREERQTQKGNTLLYSILQVEFTFFADDGSEIRCVTIGEGMDSGDKASNKAMSAALKYALTQTCMIPFECIDSETDDHELANEKKKAEEIVARALSKISVAKTIDEIQKIESYAKTLSLSNEQFQKIHEAANGQADKLSAK